MSNHKTTPGLGEIMNAADKLLNQQGFIKDDPPKASDLWDIPSEAYDAAEQLLQEQETGEKIKPDCSQHKTSVAGISDMKKLAEMIGDLHYETLAELLDYLANKFARDAINDAKAGRYSLATELNCASQNIHEAFGNIESAWEISKPFMKQ